MLNFTRMTVNRGRYGPESLSVVSRCVKIAALLPHKGVREVAARMRLIELQVCCKQTQMRRLSLISCRLCT